MEETGEPLQCEDTPLRLPLWRPVISNDRRRSGDWECLQKAAAGTGCTAGQWAPWQGLSSYQEPYFLAGKTHAETKDLTGNYGGPSLHTHPPSPSERGLR